MIDFLTEKNRLATFPDFDATHFWNLIFADPNGQYAYMFILDDESLYTHSRGKGQKKVTTRTINTHRGSINVEMDFENIYHVSPEDREIMGNQDFVDGVMKDAGINLVGNIITFYRYVNMNASSEHPLPDGRITDISRGNRAIESEFTGLVQEVMRFNDRYILTVDGNKICVHENAKISI